MSKRKKKSRITPPNRTDAAQPSVIKSVSLEDANYKKRSRFFDFTEDALLRGTYFLPFFAGALLVYGPVIQNLTLFSIAMLLVVASYHSSKFILERTKNAQWIGLLYGVQLLLLFLFYSLSQNTLCSLLLCLYVAVSAARGFIGLSTVPRFLISGVLLPVEGAAVCLAGVTSQIFEVSSKTLAVVPIGLVPAMLVVSALLIRHADMFEQKGWRRKCTVKNKKGEQIIRPQGISRLQALYFVAGPALAVGLVPLQVFPPWFLAFAFPLFRGQKLLGSFIEGNSSNEALYMECLRIAAFTAAIGIPIGIISFS